jgi:hypothetical protein
VEKNVANGFDYPMPNEYRFEIPYPRQWRKSLLLFDASVVEWEGVQQPCKQERRSRMLWGMAYGPWADTDFSPHATVVYTYPVASSNHHVFCPTLDQWLRRIISGTSAQISPA